MKTLAKIALGALMLGGAAVTAAAPAEARIGFCIGLGVPGYGSGYGPGYGYCDLHSRYVRSLPLRLLRRFLLL